MVRLVLPLIAPNRVISDSGYLVRPADCYPVYAVTEMLATNEESLPGISINKPSFLNELTLNAVERSGQSKIGKMHRTRAPNGKADSRARTTQTTRANDAPPIDVIAPVVGIRSHIAQHLNALFGSSILLRSRGWCTCSVFSVQ